MDFLKKSFVILPKQFYNDLINWKVFCEVSLLILLFDCQFSEVGKMFKIIVFKILGMINPKIR